MAEQHGLNITTVRVDMANLVYIFDLDLAERTRRLEVKNSLPYADVVRPAEEPFEFSHTLEAQIGGQIAAGFSIVGLYEDRDMTENGYALNDFMPTFIATRALKAGRI